MIIQKNSETSRIYETDAKKNPRAAPAAARMIMAGKREYEQVTQ